LNRWLLCAPAFLTEHKQSTKTPTAAAAVLKRVSNLTYLPTAARAAGQSAPHWPVADTAGQFSCCCYLLAL